MECWIKISKRCLTSTPGIEPKLKAPLLDSLLLDDASAQSETAVGIAAWRSKKSPTKI
jgi:hypothetical protein